MFARCEYTISSASARLAQNVYGAAGRVSRTQSGNRTATVSEATDTYPNAQSMPTQIGSEIATASGARARNTPAAVATPFPPRKRT